jgi:uncharacterized RDD family membrane protein YckC
VAKLVVNPTSSSRREVALARTLLSIGRDPSNDVVLPDAMVSRRHAVIEYRGSQYFIRDCNSSNGSLVNGDKVSERGLRDGDLLAIGTARLLFREEPEVESGAKVVQHPSAPRLQCPGCGSDHRQGDHFCRQCGGALQPSLPAKSVCVSCGTVVPLPAHYCNACGTVLPSEPATRPAHPEPPAPGPDPGPAPRPDPPADEEPSPPAPPVEALAPRVTPLPWQGTPSGVSVTAAVKRPVGVTRAMPTTEPRPSPLAAVPVPSAPASLGARFVAAAADAVIAGVGQALLMSPAILYWSLRDPTQAPPFVAVLLTLTLVPLALAAASLYYIYFWGTVGATPGKRLMGICVQAEDGSAPIGNVRAAIRLLGYLLSGALLGAGFLMALSGGRALHDRLAGTRVARRA